MNTSGNRSQFVICFLLLLDIKYMYTNGNEKRRFVLYSWDFGKTRFSISGLYCIPDFRKYLFRLQAISRSFVSFSHQLNSHKSEFLGLPQQFRHCRSTASMFIRSRRTAMCTGFSMLSLRGAEIIPKETTNMETTKRKPPCTNDKNMKWNVNT